MFKYIIKLEKILKPNENTLPPSYIYIRHKPLLEYFNCQVSCRLLISQRGHTDSVKLCIHLKYFGTIMEYHGDLKCEFYYSHASLILLRNLFSNRKYMKKMTCALTSMGAARGVSCPSLDLGSVAHSLALCTLCTDEIYKERDLSLSPINK